MSSSVMVSREPSLRQDDPSALGGTVWPAVVVRYRSVTTGPVLALKKTTPMLRTLRCLSTLALSVALGCGGRESGTNPRTGSGSSSSGAGSGANAATSAASSGDASMSPARNPSCPSLPPGEGSPCASPAVACAYASDAHHLCVTTAMCLQAGDGESSAWTVAAPPANCGINEPACPGTFTALASGAPCPGVNGICDYPEGACECIPCEDDGGSSLMWACRAWEPSGGCPSVPPLYGDSCQGSAYCAYGVNTCGPNFVGAAGCLNGYWTAAGIVGGCVMPQCGGAGAGGAASGTGAGSSGSPSAGSGAPTCNGGGCLCFSTPETCPSDCLKTHRADGSFVCGYSCDAPGVPCNCVYSPADGGIYVCDSFTMPACPAVAPQQCDSVGGGCMTCGGPLGPAECGCSGPFPGDAGYVWTCIGTEEACKGP
jgi:hypothetical protein